MIEVVADREIDLVADRDQVGGVEPGEPIVTGDGEGPALADDRHRVTARPRLRGHLVAGDERGVVVAGDRPDAHAVAAIDHRPGDAARLEGSRDSPGVLLTAGSLSETTRDQDDDRRRPGCDHLSTRPGTCSAPIATTSRSTKPKSATAGHAPHSVDLGQTGLDHRHRLGWESRGQHIAEDRSSPGSSAPRHR